MSLDKYNLKLQRVPIALEEKFKNTIPERGEAFWNVNKRYITVGDGNTKGGNALASKDWVINTIKRVQEQDSLDGIEVN